MADETADKTPAEAAASSGAEGTAQVAGESTAETNARLIAAYHTFIERQPHDGYELVTVDEDTYELRAEHAVARICFWDEIVEVMVLGAQKYDYPFHLHFQLREDDWEHALDLYGELVDALIAQDHHHTTRVLVVCTSGMTSFMFATKMGTVAGELGLDYEFAAVRLDKVYQEAVSYDLILLAPQAVYLHEKLADALRKPVVDIPARVFGSYNAIAGIDLVQHTIEELEKPKPAEPPATVPGAGDSTEDETADACVLAIVVKQTAGTIEIEWRVYDKGAVVLQELVTKSAPIGGGSRIGAQFITPYDITDIIDTALAHETYGRRIEVIGLAVMGAVDHGVVSLPGTMMDGAAAGSDLSARYGKPVKVVNNVNAAALGWYGQQDEYQTVVFHSQSRGMLLGGQGIVIDGKLHEGLFSQAGELQNFYGTLREDGLSLSDPFRSELWDTDRLTELLAKIFAVDIGVIAPEAICVRSKLACEAEGISQALARYVPVGKQPKIIMVPHFTEYIFLGVRTLAAEKLKQVRWERVQSFNLWQWR